jgi:hypothetical protein
MAMNVTLTKRELTLSVLLQVRRRNREHQLQDYSLN